jgi:uncharacterized protein (DUF983 family)
MGIANLLTWGVERGFFIIMLLWLRFLPGAPRWGIFVVWGLLILTLALLPRKKKAALSSPGLSEEAEY